MTEKRKQEHRDANKRHYQTVKAKLKRQREAARLRELGPPISDEELDARCLREMEGRA